MSSNQIHSVPSFCNFLKRQLKLFLQKMFFSFFKILLIHVIQQKIQIKCMAVYSENVFHLNDYCFVFKKSAVSKNQE